MSCKEMFRLTDGNKNHKTYTDSGLRSVGLKEAQSYELEVSLSDWRDPEHASGFLYPCDWLSLFTAGWHGWLLNIGS